MIMSLINYVNVDGDALTIEQANEVAMKSWWGGFRSGTTLAVLLIAAVYAAWTVTR